MGRTFANNLKTLVLMSILTSLILLAGYAIGGWGGVGIALIFAAVSNFIGFFFSDKIALASMQAQEVGPDHPLYKIVKPLASRAQIPMPRVYVSPQQAPNAFATGRSQNHAAVCATEGLLQMLNPKEVSGVMGHELAHVLHRDILIQTVAATVAGAISFLGQMWMWNSLMGGRRDDREDNGLGALGGLLVMILAPIAAGIIQMAISRQREYAADTEGAQLSGDPMNLATALEKIHYGAARIPMDVSPAFNALMIAEPMSLGERMASMFSTHPRLEDRLMNLIGRERV